MTPHPSNWRTDDPLPEWLSSPSMPDLLPSVDVPPDAPLVSAADPLVTLVTQPTAPPRRLPMSDTPPPELSVPATEVEAVAMGWTVDRHTYPWVAYLGPRFTPTRLVEIATPGVPR